MGEGAVVTGLVALAGVLLAALLLGASGVLYVAAVIAIGLLVPA